MKHNFLFPSESDSSTEDTKWYKSFRYDLNGVKKHIERLENSFILMNQTINCMSRNVEEILNHMHNQNPYSSDYFLENNPYPSHLNIRPPNNKHIRKSYHHTPLLKVVSASPIHENEERSPQILIDEEQNYENSLMYDDETKSFIDVNKSSHLSNMNYNPSQICENSLLHINTTLLESKLSPRSASSGFVSNQEDISPKSSQYYLDALKFSKLPASNDQDNDEELVRASTELNHVELMRKINQICRMQSLPESAYPLETPYTNNVIENQASSDISNAKYFTHRRVSSPIPFIRSTNL